MRNFLNPWNRRRAVASVGPAFCAAVCLCLAGHPVVADASLPSAIWVRSGYELTKVAEWEDDRPRFMELGPEGEVYVSFPREARIELLRDTNGDGTYDKRTVFIEKRPLAHAMQWFDDALWFAQSGSIHAAKDTDGDDVADEVRTILADGELPSGGGHWWRPLLIHNGHIYTGIGDSGNISDELETERQKIWSFDLQGGDKTLFVSGIRNNEKLVVRPGTDEIWGMDHGSDWFGRSLGESRGMQPVTDLNPPDEMNHYVKGGFYGHPFIVGTKLPRYEYIDREDIIELAAKTIVPEWNAPAHWAANSMTFYDGDQFPDELKGDAFVAFHGSWNRSNPGGARVDRVLFENGRPYGHLPYVTFQDDEGNRAGRPVDTLVDRDGTLLISDDHGNRIYRLRYTGSGSKTGGQSHD